jgi:hypothetical protein
MGTEGAYIRDTDFEIDVVTVLSELFALELGVGFVVGL